MASRVIIAGTRRGPHRVPSVEMFQMAGRAGRVASDEAAEVVVFADAGDLDWVASELEGGNFVVESALGNVPLVAFHLLPEIVDDRVRDADGARAWGDRTLCARQRGEVDVRAAVAHLVETRAVTERGGIYRATGQGCVASRLYFHSETVEHWRQNFEALALDDFDSCVEADVAWALADVEGYGAASWFGSRDGRCDSPAECEFEFLSRKVRRGAPGAAILWMWMLGFDAPKGVRAAATALVSDRDRIMLALKELDVFDLPGGRRFVDDLGVMVNYRVPRVLVPLCSVDGVGKTLAWRLYNMGIEDDLDMIERRDEVAEINPALASRLEDSE